MKRLTVLYDAACGLCSRTRTWLLEQPRFLELELLDAASAEARERFPGLAAGAAGPEELVVVADTGEVWRGGSAWIMCLYALREYREWALTLADPTLKPLATRAAEAISSHRRTLSRMFGLSGDRPPGAA